MEPVRLLLRLCGEDVARQLACSQGCRLSLLARAGRRRAYATRLGVSGCSVVFVASH
jgi:hypothetical protein